MQTPNTLLSQWSRLGIAFAEDPSGPAGVDPEATIVESLSVFRTDRKLAALVILWLQTYPEFVHVERLKQLSKKLGPEGHAWLGGVARKLQKTDARFGALAKQSLKVLGQPLPQFEGTSADQRLGKIKGWDPEFAEFGLRVLPLTEESVRKLRPREWLMDQPRLRLRLLLGTNWRADAFWTLSTQSPSSAYALQKLLGCSYFTAHSYWKLHQEVGSGWVESMLVNCSF